MARHHHKKKGEHWTEHSVVKIFVCFVLLSAFKYEWQKWSACKADALYYYNKDIIIAQEPPCNSQNDLYSHRLDCEIIHKEIDDSILNSKITQCFLNTHDFYNKWVAIALALAIIYITRQFLKHRFSLEKTKHIEQERMRAMKKVMRHAYKIQTPLYSAQQQHPNVHIEVLDD